jgi:hypothetical protein
MAIYRGKKALDENGFIDQLYATYGVKNHGSS